MDRPAVPRERWQLGPYRWVIDWFDTLGLPRRQLGTTLFDTPIYAYRAGHTGPKVMVTAGAHAEEAAGVAVAMQIAAAFPAGLQGWIVPCRDPLGWDGFRRTLAKAVGRPVDVRCHADVMAVLKSAGPVYEAEGAVVGVVGEAAFFSLPEDHPEMRDPGDYAHRFFVEQTAIRERVAGLRIFVHGSPLLAEGRDIYDWGGGPTLFITRDGQVGNFNRFFDRQDAPVEVAALRTLADEFQPGWLLDLHENYGSKYSLYAGVVDDAGLEGARRMIEAVQVRGFPLMRLAELARYVSFPEGALWEPFPGVFAENPSDPKIPPSPFGPYLNRRGANAYTTEMGLENPLAVRIEITEVAAWALLRYLAGDR